MAEKKKRGRVPLRENAIDNGFFFLYSFILADAAAGRGGKNGRA
jgi:hypothetical protein